MSFTVLSILVQFFLLLSNIYNAKKPYSFVLVFIKIKGTYNSENDAPTEIVYNI